MSPKNHPLSQKISHVASQKIRGSFKKSAKNQVKNQPPNDQSPKQRIQEKVCRCQSKETRKFSRNVYKKHELFDVTQLPKCCSQKISKKSGKPQMLLSKNQQKISQTPNVAFKKSAKNQSKNHPATNVASGRAAPICNSDSIYLQFVRLLPQKI